VAQVEEVAEIVIATGDGDHVLGAVDVLLGFVVITGEFDQIVEGAR